MELAKILIAVVEVFLSILIGVESISVAFLYFSGYKLVREKASPIIVATWRLFFWLGFLFTFSGVIFFAYVIDKEEYLNLVSLFIIPLLGVLFSVHKFRQYTLHNE